MTRVTFGVSVNMATKQNSLDLAMDFPLAAKTVKKSLYVDECQTLLMKTSTVTEIFYSNGTQVIFKYCNII